MSNLTLCTVLSAADGTTVATVEHLLAALRGLGVDNCAIEVDGNEVPIMDGSAEQFVDAIQETGLRELDEPRRYIKVLRPIQVKDGDSVGEIFPYNGFRLDVEIDFKSEFIGRQRLDIDITPSSFKKICRARTFGFLKDVKQLWAAGRALGSSLENTVAIGDDRILNPEGLRYTGRVRAAQDARCGWRHSPGRRSGPWPLPLLSRQPPPQLQGAPCALRSEGRLDHRRSGR